MENSATALKQAPRPKKWTCCCGVKASKPSACAPCPGYASLHDTWQISLTANTQRCHQAGTGTRADARIKKAIRLSAPVPCSKEKSKAACTSRGSFPSVTSSSLGLCVVIRHPQIYFLLISCFVGHCLLSQILSMC